MKHHKTIAMFGIQFRHFIGNCLICLLIAFNTYPAMQNIMADALGTPNSIIPICTMTGIDYISLDTSDKPSDTSTSKSSTCFFCQANATPLLPPCNQGILGPINAYSERLAILQYYNIYHKHTAPRPHPRGPPLISST